MLIFYEKFRQTNPIRRRLTRAHVAAASFDDNFAGWTAASFDVASKDADFLMLTVKTTAIEVALDLEELQNCYSYDFLVIA